MKLFKTAKAYAEAVKRKDIQIEELKKEKSILLKTLFEKEKQIVELNALLNNLKNKIIRK